MKEIRYRPKIMTFVMAGGEDSRISHVLDEDRGRFHVTASGEVVVPLGEISYFARDLRGKGPGYHE